MKTYSKILIIFLLIVVFPFATYARSGCCSWHGGVCGCGCCDGTPLSATCAPYYPGCGGRSYTPSCPLNSSYNSASGQCECNYGYVVQNNSCVYGNTYCQTNFAYGSNYNSISNKCECSYGEFVSDGSCISYDDYCHDNLGYGSRYNSLTDKCECTYGYIYNGSKCVDEATYCRDSIGLMSRYNSLTEKCECMSGYQFNGSTCVYKEIITCPYNSYLGTDDKCHCNAGYEPSGSTCITYDQACQKQYGINSHGDKDNCYCDNGYKWNSSKTSCVKIYCPNNSSLIGSQCLCDAGYIMKNDVCITHAQDCKNTYGNHAYGEKGNNNNSSCYCETGYEWNPSKTSCIKSANTSVSPKESSQKNLAASIIDINTNENSVNNVNTSDNATSQSSIEFKLVGNERIRECGDFNCKVIKFGSTGTATIIGKNGDWFNIKINENGNAIEGWISGSLISENIKNNINQDQQNNSTIDNNVSSNGFINFINKIFNFFKKK